MGKINRGILGGFSGKVANIIGGSWKGIAYMRSQPLSVSQPNTAAQQVQKAKFGNLVELAQALLLLYVQPLWNRLAVRMSGYNFFIQGNNLAVDDTGLSNPSALQLAPGNDTGAAIDTLTGTNGSTLIQIDWTNNAGTGTALATDLAYGLTYNEDTEELGFMAATVERSVEQIETNTESNNTSGDTIHGWLSFKSADGLKISGTSYATATVS